MLESMVSFGEEGPPRFRGCGALGERGHSHPWESTRSGGEAWHVNEWGEQAGLRRPEGVGCAYRDHWRSGDAVAA